MVDQLPAMTTARARVDHVLKMTGCPGDSDLAKWIGLNSAQHLGVTITRGKLTLGVAQKMRDATGASLEWLLENKGVPFPSGAKPYPGAIPGSAEARLKLAEDRLDAAGVILLSLVRLVSARIQGAAAELVPELRQLAAANPSLQQLLEVAAAAAEASPESKGQAGRRAPRVESSGTPPRRGK